MAYYYIHTDTGQTPEETRQTTSSKGIAAWLQGKMNPELDSQWA